MSREKIKIYCVFCDTMPLSKDIINFSNINKMQRLIQVGGCFTATSLLQMMTGKMPSDLQRGGFGHRGLDKYRDKKTKQINTPWEKNFILSKLSDNNWRINLHNLPPNNYIHGDIYSDSYPGGYKKRYSKVKKYEKSGLGGKVVDKILLEDNLESFKWHEREINFIESITSEDLGYNTFYFIEYEHFHAWSTSYLKKSKSKIKKTKDRANKRIIKLLNKFNFNEPNSIFWFFSDHGFPSDINEIPKANGYLSWVLFKDNTIDKIKSGSHLISIRDFMPTILSKFKLNCEYKQTEESKNINKKENKNRIYFVEDGRSKVDKIYSTSAIACMPIEWAKKYPTKILQVAYFKKTKKFYYNLNKLDNDGFFKKCKKINKHNKKYKDNLLQLRKKLIDRFEWVK